MAERRPKLAVVGYGMWTAAGHDGPSSVAAMRAVVPGAIGTRLWDPTAGATLTGFQVHAYHWWEGEGFLPDLAAVSIRQCHAQLESLGAPAPDQVPILIGVAPAHRPTRSGTLERTLAVGLEARLGFPLPPGSEAVAGGRIAIAGLLGAAEALLDRHPAVILLGVESFLRQAIVEHYIEAGRVLCGTNSSGFLPGEASAALIVTRPGASGRTELRITGLGMTRDASGAGGSAEHPADARGLTTAVGDALAMSGVEMYDIALLMADLNGEHFKFKEAVIAAMRHDRVPPEGVSRRPRGYIEHWNVVETIGEVGAALIPAAMGWAFEAGRSGYLPARHILFHAGEDDGSRMAIVGEFHG